MISSWQKFNKDLVGQAKKRGIPISGTFELTSRCNMKCKMCYICRPADDKCVLKNERSAEEWIRIAEEARNAGMLYLLLTGGEVFLRKDFRMIYEEISKLGLKVTIFTNATMITPEIAEWLGRIPPLKVGVTLYGADSDTYEKVCGYPDGFQRALNGIDLLMAEGIPLQLRTTIIRDNVHDIDKLYEIANQRKTRLYICRNVTPRREGNLTSPESQRLSPDELAAFELYIHKYLNNNTGSTNFPETDSEMTDDEDDIITEIEGSTSMENTNSAFYCNAGKCIFWVTWDGRMTVCGDAVEPVTYPFTSGFKDAWERLKMECSKIPVCNECNSCELRIDCIACPARLKIETGFYDRPAPYLCESMHRQKELERR